MRFQAAAQYEAGVADVDPIVTPATILLKHVMSPRIQVPKEAPGALYLALIGTGAETVTLDLYFLIENLGMEAKSSDYQNVDARWFQFATGQVITNGVLTKITAGLPNGGRIYGRRTADSIAGGQTRSLMMAWAE